MAILLSIYTKTAFREERLPIINNSDYSIVLDKDIYGIKKDITILLCSYFCLTAFAGGADRKEKGDVRKFIS